MTYRERWDELVRLADKVPALKDVIDRIEEKYGGWLPEMLSTTDIVQRYGVSKGTVSRHRKEGKLKYVGRGRNIRHCADDVAEWAEKYGFGQP